MYIAAANAFKVLRCRCVHGCVCRLRRSLQRNQTLMGYVVSQTTYQNTAWCVLFYHISDVIVILPLFSESNHSIRLTMRIDSFRFQKARFVFSNTHLILSDQTNQHVVIPWTIDRRWVFVPVFLESSCGGTARCPPYPGLQRSPSQRSRLTGAPDGGDKWTGAAPVYFGRTRRGNCNPAFKTVQRDRQITDIQH